MTAKIGSFFPSFTGITAKKDRPTHKLFLFLLACLSLAGCGNIETVETHDDQGRLERYQRDKKNFAKQGLYQKFHANGTVMIEAHYVGDTLNGERKYFYESGNLETVETFRNGTYDGLYRHYYPNGVLQIEQQYVNGALQGLSTRYYANGVVEEKVTLRDNEEDGPFKEYYENGNLKAEGAYKPSELGPAEQGELKEYDESGQLVRIADCSDGRCSTRWKKDQQLK